MMSYEALRSYAPLAFCEVGGHIVRANLMIDDSICFDCVPDKKKGGGPSRENKKRPEGSECAPRGEGRPSPISAGRGKEKTLRRRHEGQLSLQL